jgi:hypothetical protein
VFIKKYVTVFKSGIDEVITARPRILREEVFAVGGQMEAHKKTL